MNHILTGAGLRILAVFLITAMSAVIHAIGDHIEVGQIIFWRSAFAIIPILGYMALQGNFPNGLKTSYPRLHLTRGLFGVVTMAASFVSLIYLPVANAQALGFLAPVLTLPLAAIMLKEKLSPAIISAVLLGLAGVILILFNALEIPGEGALIGVIAGLIYAFLMAFLRVYVKNMTRTESTATIAFYFALSGSLVGLATIIFGWTLPNATQWLMLCGAGLLGGLAHIAGTESVRLAPVSVVAPFDFTGLIWAAGFDIILFRHFPAPIAIAGMLMITAAALIVTIRPSAQVTPDKKHT